MHLREVGCLCIIGYPTESSGCVCIIIHFTSMCVLCYNGEGSGVCVYYSVSYGEVELCVHYSVPYGELEFVRVD